MSKRTSPDPLQTFNSQTSEISRETCPKSEAQMNRVLNSAILALTLLFSGAVSAQDFQIGLIAARIGDFATALREWTPLAEQGNASAQLNLGVLYAKGEGVLQDFVYAHLWSNIAAANGNENAAKLRDIVSGKMSAADISIAQRLSRECVAKNYISC
jgi:hypothetical protein